jgi:thiaminase/transcriptional activator TenA
MIYLKAFARSLSLITARLTNTEHIKAFLKFIEGAIVTEQEVVHSFFREQFSEEFHENILNISSVKTPYRASLQCNEYIQKISPACFAYTNYLSTCCALEPLEVAVAAVLPCFWVYQEVGQHVARHAAPNNPFSRWIETYAGEEFIQMVAQAIQIFDELAAHATVTMQQKMVTAFYHSTVLEYQFWHDAYHLKCFAASFNSASISSIDGITF